MKTDDRAAKIDSARNAAKVALEALTLAVYGHHSETRQQLVRAEAWVRIAIEKHEQLEPSSCPPVTE